MRAAITTILLLNFLASCTYDKVNTAAQNALSDSAGIEVNSTAKADTAPLHLDTTILHVDSAVIAGKTYTALYRANDTLYIINAKSDTIIKVADLHPNFEFNDFNSDGYKDIRIHYLSNVPAVQDVLLFDRTRENFTLVTDFSNFPAPLPLKGTKYYYSYHRSGCADMNWDSDLFYIDDIKAVRIGNIAGYECENRDIKDGIYIYKVKGDKEILVKKLPISTIQKYEEYKWGFIKDYWTKNYKLFL